MRADRLLALLLLLQARGRVPAPELAARLEVSERTIYRDLDALSAAGVPVYAERGRGGGCVLDEHYRTSLTGLSADEIQTLLLASSPGPLADLGLARTISQALRKLAAAVPSGQSQAEERLRQRVYLDPAGWARGAEETPHLPAIQEAVWNDRRLQLTYRDSAGSLSERSVEPYGLVAKAGVWYLVAGSGGELRVFRVSRVRAATVLAEGFVRPADFDLAEYWRDWSSQFVASWQRFTLVVRVEATAAPILFHSLGEWALGALEMAPVDERGRRRVSLAFDREESALGWALSYGTLVEVLEPVALRGRIAAIARATAALYAASPEPGD